MNSMIWSGERDRCDDSQQILRFYKHHAALGDLGMIWCLLMGKWSTLGSQWNAPTLFCLLLPSFSKSWGYVTATFNEVSQLCLPPGQECVLALIGAPLFTDAPQSWDLCVYPTSRTQKICQEVPSSVLRKTLSLKEGVALCTSRPYTWYRN